MNQKRNVALDCAIVCLALGPPRLLILPASGEGSNDSSPNMALALKCVDLTSAFAAIADNPRLSYQPERRRRACVGSHARDPAGRHRWGDDQNPLAY